MAKRGTKEMYDARMKSGKSEEVQREFEEWVSDMRYEALTPAMRAYLWETFVGGWGAKVRQMKRRRKKRKANEQG